MIPILGPAQFPWILEYAFFLAVMLGIPTAFVSLVIFFMLERVPSPRVRLLLPAAGAVLILAVTLVYFKVPQSEEEYRQTWAMMMITGFLLNALVILAPFPFIRRYSGTASPILMIAVAVFVTFYLLTCFGFIGGDAQKPPADEFVRMAEIAILVIAESVIAALIYAGITVLHPWVNKGTTKGV